MGRYICESLSSDEAASFIEANHRQGSLSAKGRSLGLYLKGELIGVLQVGPPRTSLMRKKYSAEIYRLAFKKGVRAPGGASKLIKSYIKLYHPADFFTYQDTTGENTNVYGHSGMSLVKDGLKSKKKYLVAPGKTLETASRRENLGLAYATRYGPDRILGTKLGEVFHEDGSRKTNLEIFLEDLNWHLEETTGDSVWEWVDNQRTYYTYKITATDSDKYYYGVSHVKIANASEDDCLNDGYFGSGNSSGLGKFGRWKSKHKAHLIKEIVGLYPRKSFAYEAEEKLIGDLFKTDPNCLNSIVGGKLQPHASQKYLMASCSLHGETLHSNDKCLKCRSMANYSMEICEVHGETIFHGGTCKRCQAVELKSLKECPVHGLTKHQGSMCYRCSVKSVVSQCDVHGETKFFGGKCMKCRNGENVKISYCEIHGETKHLGERCYTCISHDAIELKVCPVHGETKHRGTNCFKCFAGKVKVSEKECPVHGLTKHQGDRCAKCSRGAVVMKQCPVHGETKHRGRACFKCSAAKRLAKKKS